MRLLAALALIVASNFLLAAPARALSLEVPRLRAPALELASVSVPELPALVELGASFAIAGPSELFLATPSLVVPPRYAWVTDDGRAFWYAAGASAVVALGTHVLVGLPVLVITTVSTAGLAAASPAVHLPVLMGVAAIYLLGQSALSSAAATLTFNWTSDLYQGNYVSALASHVGGAVLGVSVTGLTFGIGGLLFGGLVSIAEFTGSAGLSAIGVFSLLGALPAVVVGGIALVGVPAIFGAWAIAVTAGAKDGYAIDPIWRSAPPAAPSARGDAASLPVAALALPLP